MRKKPKKEILHPEVERQLPAKQVVLPSLDELNRLMERLLDAERRRARRESAGILTAVLLVCLLILGGMAWFTSDIMQQLKAERSLSEKSREDMLQLIYSGRLAGPTQTEPARTPDPAPAPPQSSVTQQPSAVLEAPEDEPAPTPIRGSINVQTSDGIPMRLPIPPPR